MSSSSTFTRPDGTVIHYKVYGRHRGGVPVLILARGGMQSSMATLLHPSNPWNPVERLSHDKYMLITMDQRMSRLDEDLPEDHDIGWETFRDDQIALLDHLGVTGRNQCHLLGACIGPSYALRLLRDFPDRFGRAVLLQPIGINVHTTEPKGWDGTNAGCENDHWFGSWAREMTSRGRASQGAVDRLHRNMFGPSRSDFVFSVTREDVRTRIAHPLLVFCGRDILHPAETAREISRLASGRATLVEEWRDVGPEKLAVAERAIDQFLCYEQDLL